MQIRFFGHAAFSIVTANGTRIVTDPLPCETEIVALKPPL